MFRPNKTNVARVKVHESIPSDLLEISGFIVKEDYPELLSMQPVEERKDIKTYICHCEDVALEDLLKFIGDRDTITADELKHISRMGMGACRGSRCMPRAVQTLRNHGIQVISDLTPRGPWPTWCKWESCTLPACNRRSSCPRVLTMEMNLKKPAFS